MTITFALWFTCCTHQISHSFKQSPLFVKHKVHPSLLCKAKTIFQTLQQPLLINWGGKQQLEMYKCMNSAPWTDSFWEAAKGIALILFLNSRGAKLQFFIWTSCLSECHADVSLLVHLQNLTQFSRGKMENTCSTMPASYRLMGRLKPSQTKFAVFGSESVDGETTRGERLTQLHMSSDHIIIDLCFPISSSVCLYLLQSALCVFRNISHGSVVPLVSVCAIVW